MLGVNIKKSIYKIKYNLQSKIKGYAIISSNYILINMIIKLNNLPSIMSLIIELLCNKEFSSLFEYRTK